MPRLSAKDQARLDNAHAEIFHVNAAEARQNRKELRDLDREKGKPLGWHEENSEHSGCTRAGWFYWCCLSGCLPEGPAIGPFRSEYAASKDCIESWGLYDDNV